MLFPAPESSTILPRRYADENALLSLLHHSSPRYRSRDIDDLYRSLDLGEGFALFEAPPPETLMIYADALADALTLARALRSSKRLCFFSRRTLNPVIHCH